MGVTDSTFLLNMCIRDIAERIKISHPEISKILYHFIYCYDILYGTNSRKKAIELIHLLDQILRQHGFLCRKFFSDDHQTWLNIPEKIKKENNSTNVFLKADQNDDIIPSGTNIAVLPNQKTKCLGLYMSSINNTSYFTFDHLRDLVPTETTLSRRIISRRVGSVYDPIGMCSFFTIYAKLALSLSYRLHQLHSMWVYAIKHCRQ